MDWYLGTMGFSYETWEGVFYPQGMPSRNYLAHYSGSFNAVEIDSTFYGTPRSEVVQRWVAVTPENFKFCTKVPRRITHDLGLVGAEREMSTFLDTIRTLGEKLGPVLIQFPPSFVSDQFSVLEAFLSGLPADVRFAVEVRHGSWYTQNDGFSEAKMAAMLERYGICWAATHYPGLPVRIHPTTNFLYIRWIGQHGTYATHDHERVDRLADLMAWWQLLQGYLNQVEAVYGFFNNDFAGHAPATCNRFKSIVGLPVGGPSLPQQGTLF